MFISLHLCVKIPNIAIYRAHKHNRTYSIISTFWICIYTLKMHRNIIFLLVVYLAFNRLLTCMSYIPNIQLHLESSKAFFSLMLPWSCPQLPLPHVALKRGWPRTLGREIPMAVGSPSAPQWPAKSGDFFSWEKRDMDAIFWTFDGDDGYFLLIFDLEVWRVSVLLRLGIQDWNVARRDQTIVWV